MKFLRVFAPNHKLNMNQASIEEDLIEFEWNWVQVLDMKP